MTVIMRPGPGIGPEPAANAGIASGCNQFSAYQPLGFQIPDANDANRELIESCKTVLLDLSFACLQRSCNDLMEKRYYDFKAAIAKAEGRQ